MRFGVSDKHKAECGFCYGMGCLSCSGRGWHETAEGQAEREAAEDDWADAQRDERALERNSKYAG